MRPLRLVALFVCVLLVASLLAVTGFGSHGTQLWAGQWNYSYPGVAGGFALRHETDTYGAELLEAIGGVACPEPTDYFAGAYTIPDEPPPEVAYVDTGKFRGCTVDNDPKRLQGRYESNRDPSVAGSFDLTLDPATERWTGTFQPDGDPQAHSWTGFFDNHFDGDGASNISTPPYGTTTPDEPDPGGSGEPPPPPANEDTSKCFDKDATITPNPAAPPGLAISGTASDDVIVGTNGPDRILGLGGNDLICGFGGDDELIGAEGEERIFGGAGNDVLDGGSGEDFLYGETGNDQLLGGTEKSYLEGGPGNDKLMGGEADDQLYGGLYQGPGGYPESAVTPPDDDELRGEGGRDGMWGGRGRDRLHGGAGDDGLRGGSGNDVLFGEAGTDRVEGGGGNDRIDGGDGAEHKINDVFGDVTSYFEATGGVQVNVRPGRVTGGLGADSIRGIETVLGSRFDDVLRGTGGPDILYGDLGDDHISGLGGDDTLIGGAHDDRLIGGPDRDFVHGSTGFDHCSGERRFACERLIRGAPK
jgi:Ca2+-binding RTX toxin-like protein